ncbi:MAG: phosphatidate cytidylyltransferase [Gemmobacter sp.]|nr:phosphatidate cytidylyltransferase [Gemmobacter sp.]
MSGISGNFGDLRTRVISAIVMAVVGIADIWLGGAWFLALLVVVGGAMMWELSRMLGAAPMAALMMGALASVVMVAVPMLPAWGWLLLAVPPLVASALVARDRVLCAVYGSAALLATFALYGFRLEQGLVWLIWLILVVVASDVAGYFAGRTLGGPKFWPAVSPKKTWSGTVAGWVGAALVGLGFAAATQAGVGLALISALVAFAAQMGDIAESAIKRRAGVKDSSNLIPGHGGVLDRFDALLGASLVMLVSAALIGLPEVRL